MRIKYLFSLLLAITMATQTFSQAVSKDLLKQAKRGDVEAQLNVAKAYIKNNENAKASKWLYTATKSGNKEAENILYSFYSKELEKYAKEGNAQAQYVMGNFFYNGQGVNKDLKAAAKWYDLAVENKHKEAQKSLGSFYSSQLENRAKKLNEADMQYYLGLCYLNGVEVKAKKEEAAKWFEKAMLQGHEKAREQFFSFDSKIKTKHSKTVRINQMTYYWGYVDPTATKPDITKSPEAEISIVNGYRTLLSINGEKDNDTIKNATIDNNNMNFYFKGDVVLKYNSNSLTGDEKVLNTDITLKKGGKFACKGLRDCKLEDDVILNIDLATAQPKFSIKKGFSNSRNDYKLPYDSVKNILKSYDYTKEIYIPASLERLNEVEKINEVVVGYKEQLSINDKNSLIYSSVLNFDTIYINGNMFSCTLNPNANNRIEHTYITKNGDTEISWDNQYYILRLTKRFKDAIVQYHRMDSEADLYKNNIIYNNKNRFTGLFYIGKIALLSQFDAASIKEILSAEKITDIPVVFHTGTHTDSKGFIEGWKHALPTYIAEQYRTKMEDVKAKELEKKIAQLKAKREAAKKQLLAEGFDAKDIETLLYKCTVKIDMSRKLIERANELNSNLTIGMNMKIGGLPRTLIQIVNAETAETIFLQFIGYNIFNRVSVIENM